jgi:hypothetical protein
MAFSNKALRIWIYVALLAYFFLTENFKYLATNLKILLAEAMEDLVDSSNPTLMQQRRNLVLN